MAYQFQTVGSLGPILVDALKIGFVWLGMLIGLYMLPGHVRFGSKADICNAKRHVRFTLESRHMQCSAHVRFGPIADIGERDRSVSYRP